MLPDQENDSLIDWTSPAIVQHTTRPLIPLPMFTSPLSDIDIEDNPFDVLERQINDDALDLLNVSALFRSNEGSPTPNQEKTCKSEVLVQIEDDDDKPEKLVTEFQQSECLPLPLLEMSSTVSSVSDSTDFRELVANRISHCINEALNKTTGHTSIRATPPSASSLKTNSRLNEGFVSLASSNDQEWRRERSRSVELSWGAFEIDEDLRSIVMPTWNDEISSSDEETPSQRLSRSLPIEGSESWVKKNTTSESKTNTNNMRGPLVIQDANVKVKKTSTISRSGSLRAVIPVTDMKVQPQEKQPVVDKLKVNQKLLLMKKDAVTSTLLSKQKQWYTPVASSTPQSSRGKRDTRISRFKSSITPEENKSRAPSPDSTSNIRPIHEMKMTPKNRVSKMVTMRKRSLSCKKVSSSQTGFANNKSLNKSMREKENILPFKV